ncbi:UNVERIFIED_CONTAM: hypothetical protein HDU68_010997 [Siphonaria sp. JEL0065]|nr:hypothetical protein HDU68_010997 [Siphonaria sp. JEL0065]
MSTAALDKINVANAILASSNACITKCVGPVVGVDGSVSVLTAENLAAACAADQTKLSTTFATCVVTSCAASKLSTIEQGLVESAPGLLLEYCKAVAAAVTTTTTTITSSTTTTTTTAAASSSTSATTTTTTAVAASSTSSVSQYTYEVPVTTFRPATTGLLSGAAQTYLISAAAVLAIYVL